MRRLYTGLIAMAVALSVNVLALGVNVTPVAANTTCSAGTFCVWPLANFQDYFWPTEHEHFGGDTSNWPFGIENDDDSIKNEETGRVLVYAGSGYGEGVTYCALPDEWEGDINLAYDDNGDSHDVQTLTSCGTNPRP